MYILYVYHICVLDLCPHRLAPLSQGRVDPLTGCIECPYRKCTISFIIYIDI